MEVESQDVALNSHYLDSRTLTLLMHVPQHHTLSIACYLSNARLFEQTFLISAEWREVIPDVTAL